jgi:hypothetical protein
MQMPQRMMPVETAEIMARTMSSFPRAVKRIGGPRGGNLLPSWGQA